MHTRSAIPVYLALIALECALAWFVTSRVRKRGGSTRELIGGRWSTPGEVIADLLIAAAMWGIWRLFLYAWSALRATESNAAVRSMLPHGSVAIVVWITLSVVAGFAEELAFRGYLQQRLYESLRRWPVAISVQALIFGAVHAYEGGQAALRIVVFGAFFGIVAWWRKSLRPGMIAHALTDIGAGVFGI